MPETKLSYEQLLAENNMLREENRFLRQRLGIGEASPSIELELTATNPTDMFSDPTVTQSSSTNEKIGLFMSLFRGREDVYAKRWYSVKTEKSGYSPFACLPERMGTRPVRQTQAQMQCVPKP